MLLNCGRPAPMIAPLWIIGPSLPTKKPAYGGQSVLCVHVWEWNPYPVLTSSHWKQHSNSFWKQRDHPGDMRYLDSIEIALDLGYATASCHWLKWGGGRGRKTRASNWQTMKNLLTSKATRREAMVANSTLNPRRIRKQYTISPFWCVASYTKQVYSQDNTRVHGNDYLQLSKSSNLYLKRNLTQISMTNATIPVRIPMIPTKTQRMISIWM